MKVSAVEAIPLVVPLDSPWRTGVATFSGYYMVLVKVTTDDGLVGYGESLARYQPRVWSELVNDVLGPQVVGKDPFDNEAIWHHLYRSFGSFSGHSRGVLLEAISGIDIALWDLMGKATGRPVSHLLGGTSRSEIAAYGSSVLVQDTKAMTETAVGMAERGFNWLKVKIGRSPAKEREVLSDIRSALGDEITIDVELVNLPSDIFFGSYGDGNPVSLGEYDMWELSNNTAFPDPNVVTFTCAEVASDENPSGVNDQALCDEELDALFAEQAATTDTEARRDIFYRIQQIMHDNLYWMPLWHDPDLWALSARFENAEIAPATQFWNAANWDVSS